MITTYEITGATFTHRDTLKNAGAKYNGDSKAWSIRADIEYAPDRATLETLARLAGLRFAPPILSPKAKVVPGVEAATPAAPVASAIDETFGGRIVQGEKNRRYMGTSRFYETMLAGNARVYAEFLSVADLADFFEGAAPLCAAQTDRFSGWRDDSGDFLGTRTMQEAIDISRNGWVKGVEIADQVRRILSVDQPERRHRQNAAVGGSVNVGRMLAGNPMHMRRHPRQPSQKVITLINDSGFHAGVKAADVMVRAGIVAAAADMLEANGYSCEIINVDKNYAPGAGDPSVVLVTRIKTAGEKFNINDMVFGLGHPSMHRRFGFAAIGMCEELRSAWFTLGRPTDGIPRNLDAGTYGLPRPANLPRVYTTDIADKIKAFLPACLPADLPVKFEIGE